MPTCKLTKKALSHIIVHVFSLHFLRIHHDYLFKRVFESLQAQFLSGNISGLLAIYLFNCNSSKSTFSMLKTQLDVFLSTVFINKLKFICFLQCKITRTSFFLLMLCVLICTFYKNLIVLHHGDIILYSILTSVSNSHFH